MRSLYKHGLSRGEDPVSGAIIIARIGSRLLLWVGRAAEPAPAEASGISVLPAPVAVVGVAALASFLLPSSGYQLLKAAGGTAGYEVEAACPRFDDWRFRPPGWRWAQRGEIQVVRRWGGCLNGAQWGAAVVTTGLA